MLCKTLIFLLMPQEVPGVTNSLNTDVRLSILYTVKQQQPTSYTGPTNSHSELQIPKKLPSSSSITVGLTRRSGSATVCVTSSRFCLVLSSSFQSAHLSYNTYRGDTGQREAINTVVVNPLNTDMHTHSPLFEEHVLVGNSMRVKIAKKQLSLPVCTQKGRHSFFWTAETYTCMQKNQTQRTCRQFAKQTSFIHQTATSSI